MTRAGSVVLTFALVAVMASAAFCAQMVTPKFSLNGKPVSIKSMVDAKGVTHVQFLAFIAALGCRCDREHAVDEFMYRVERDEIPNPSDDLVRDDTADNSLHKRRNDGAFPPVMDEGPHTVGFVADSDKYYVPLRQAAKVLGCAVEADKKGQSINLKADVSGPVNLVIALQPEFAESRNAKEAKKIREQKLRFASRYLELALAWRARADRLTNGSDTVLTVYTMNLSSDYQLNALNYERAAHELKGEGLCQSCFRAWEAILDTRQ